MVKAQVVHGADISHHQTTVDLARAKQAGLQFLYHKATEGTSYVDPEFGKRRQQAKTLGLPFGAYHFARPDQGKGDARAEARRFIAIAQPKPGDLRPALDLEVQTSGVDLNTWARGFLDEVKSLTGLDCVVYSPYSLASFAGHTMWVPRYNDSNTPPKQHWDIWQFSNGIYGTPDSFPGLGHVDLNTFRSGLGLRDILIPDPDVEEHAPVTTAKDAFLLRLQHSSMQRTDPVAQKQSDADRIFSPGNHVVTLTEVGMAQNKTGRDLVKKAARARGYGIHLDRFDCGVAVKIPGAKIVDMGYEGPLLKGVGGDHPNIGVAWITVNHPTIGRATFAAMHWMTRNGVPARGARNDWLSQQATAFLEKKAAGSAIAFLAGDTNEDDKTGDIFPKSSPWTTCWDELHKYPSTLGNRTVDMIASYDKDRRVRCIGARVLPDLGLHTDHRTIQATYSINPVRS